MRTRDGSPRVYGNGFVTAQMASRLEWQRQVAAARAQDQALRDAHPAPVPPPVTRATPPRGWAGAFVARVRLRLARGSARSVPAAH